MRGLTNLVLVLGPLAMTAGSTIPQGQSLGTASIRIGKQNQPRAVANDCPEGSETSTSFAVDVSSAAGVAVNGPLIVDDVETLVRAAIDGIGLAFVSDERVAPELASGALIRVLEDWCQPFPGFFLYYPSRRQQPPALAALISTLRL